MSDRKQSSDGTEESSEQMIEQPDAGLEPEAASAQSDEQKTPAADEAKPTDEAPAPEPTIEELQATAQEYLEGWQRARAEFSNYKRRVDRELLEAYQRAAGDILTRYLGVLDDLERALKDRPQEGETAAWAEGIEMIYRKMKSILEAEGVEPIQAAGERFDPNFHEAISHEDDNESPSGHVIEVVQPGYRLGDRVLRPAMVRVAK